MFLKEIRNIFVSRTQILCPQQMLPTRANRETFVSATICPQHCVLVCHHLKKLLERNQGMAQCNYKELTNGNFDDCTKKVLADLQA